MPFRLLRLGLARALFNQPFLVVLDEPNSSLDQVGEEALTAAIRAVRDRGGIVIVVAHRASALEACDQIILISDGRAQMLERTRDVIRSVPVASGMNGKGRRINPSVAQAASELPQLIGEHHP